jgi:hypothetical protein
MNISVQRQWLTENSTCGAMSIDDVFQCFTLEPPVRLIKPYCIPAGTYNVVLLESPRFGFITPHVMNVPNFTEIEIHPGNYPHDTKGCCLIGQTHAVDFIGNSRTAFDALMLALKMNPENISITYTGGTQNV